MSVRSVSVFVDLQFCVGHHVSTCVLESMMWLSSRVRCDGAIWVHAAFADGSASVVRVAFMFLMVLHDVLYVVHGHYSMELGFGSQAAHVENHVPLCAVRCSTFEIMIQPVVFHVDTCCAVTCVIWYRFE